MQNKQAVRPDQGIRLLDGDRVDSDSEFESILN